MVEPTPLACPVKGCSLSVDITFKSSDGRLLGAHSINLSDHSDGFPPVCFASSETMSDAVELTESSEVIEIMLQYMHNTRLARLEDISPTTVWDIAYAAEKYLIYPLMEVCRLHIKYRFVKEMPRQVLVYAAKYDYDDLFDEAAPRTIDWSLDDAYTTIGASPHFVAWVRYRERWLQFQAAFRVDPPTAYHKGGSLDCSLWWQFLGKLLKLHLSELPQWRSHMISFKDEYLKDCSCCGQRASVWANVITNRYARPIPNASSL
ncbi:hypothetical protein F5887DRAFT_988115, partial [Amanita rubescens]